MMEFAFGFIWVVVMRLESGSARLSVNFPYSLGFFGTRWRETGPEANGGCPSPPVSLPGPPPQDFEGHSKVSEGILASP